MKTRSLLRSLHSALILLATVIASPATRGDVEVTVRDHIDITPGQKPPGLTIKPTIPPPPAGEYAGLVRITQNSTTDQLAVSTVLRVTARVSLDGALAILAASPLPPKAAADVESSITRCTRDQGGNYFTEDSVPVQVVQQGNLLIVQFENPPIQITPAATSTGPVTIKFPSKYVRVEFTLRRKNP